MQIRIDYELIFECPQPTPMILMLNIHFTRVSDLVIADHIITNPPIPITAYRDGFGNWCSRIVAPPGDIRISTNALISDNGLPDEVDGWAPQHAVEDLPAETLVFLLGSRYCETDRLTETVWALFGQTPPGWPRVKAICDFVHGHLAFGYQHARATKTALEAFNERVGGFPTSPDPMDFSAWFEAYLGGSWHIFDPRNNIPRVGRVLIAQGRDTADVPLSNTFGPNVPKSFKVWTDEVRGQ
jgi:transglutaminase-like putative cysteine protease